MKTLNVALVQMNSGPAIAENLTVMEDLIREAADRGATFILTPENSCHIRAPAVEKLKSSPDELDHPAIKLAATLASELGVSLLIGSVSVKVSPDRIANRSYLFDANGDNVAKYDKIHLFDVDLETGERHRESDLVAPGTQVTVARMPFGTVGMSICYDLRFAYLYRAMAKAGATIMTVPSAFTVPTGEAHWSTLLRARAIETGSFVLAPAQTGEHEGGRRTYGHSMIVGPWGEVIAEAGDEPCVITAELDLSAVERARTAIPSLKHDRDLSFLAP